MAEAKEKAPAKGLRITVTRAELLPRLSAVAEITDPKSPMPSGACVLIEAGDVGASANLRATCVPEAIVRDLDVRPTRAGRAMVYAKDLLDIVTRLSDAPIDLFEDGPRLRINQCLRRYSLPTFPADDMPPTVAIAPHGVAVGAVPLVRLLKKASAAMSDDSTLPSVYGVRLMLGAGKMEARACNGHCGAMASLPLADEGVLDIMLPGPTIKHIAEVVAGLDEVRIAKLLTEFGGAALHLFGPGLFYSTSIALPEGQAPPPLKEQIFDNVARGKHVIHCDRKAMLIAAKSIGVIGDRLRLRTSPGGVILSGFGERGDGEEEVAAESTIRSGPVNAKYFQAALAFHEADKVSIWHEPGERVFNGVGGEYLFTADGTADAYVVMTTRYDQIDLDADPGP